MPPGFCCYCFCPPRWQYWQQPIRVIVNLIDIDGSFGEGGGQILRTALVLSAISGKPFSLTNIRARRSQPGLKPQHVKAIEAAAEICQADFSPVAPGTPTLRFEPKQPVAGNYRFDIGTAGATSLVLQTALLALSYADAPSTVTVTGGTHVPWSPCFHYLDWHWRHYLHLIGFSFGMTLARAGFYPPGGGEINASVSPHVQLKPLTLTERGALLRVRGVSGVAKLPLSIAERQRAQALKQLAGLEQPVTIQVETIDALSAGTYLVLLAEFEHSQYCVTALGARGKRAEAVADEAIDGLKRFLASPGVIDAHLADQLLIPLSLASGVSQIKTESVTTHLLTNAEIIDRFVSVSIEIEGSIGEPGSVTITPASL
jgi:RNA 3'-terminal phosphate cyclase (ATP)